jgi:hypothetical protein
MALTFSERGHRYRLDGRSVPSVTTLIGDGLPKKALQYWSARTVAEWVADNPERVEQLRAMGRGPMVNALKEVPWEKRDTAQVRGTDVHALAERLVHGDRVDVPEHLADYVSSCVDFLDEWRPRPLVVERPVAHRAHWWAGKPDMFAALPDGRVILFDYKTSASGVRPETAYQLAAYSHAEFYAAEDGAEHPIPQADMAAVVWLRPDGYDVVPLRADDSVYADFRHIAWVAKAAKRAAGTKSTPGHVGDPLPAPSWDEPATLPEDGAA